MYKALMIDLDGTTVKPFEKTASPRVIEAIAKVKKHLFVGVATGRRINSARPILDQLSLTGPCILNHGCQVYDPKSGKFTHEICLTDAAIRQIYAFARAQGIEVKLMDPYATVSMTGEEVAAFDGSFTSQRVLSAYMPLVPLSTVDYVVEALGKISDVNVIKLSSLTEGTIAIEITHTLATKQHGIAEVARELGLKTSEMVAVGDGYNDFPLLMACGLKFAMGNAVDELKAIADFVAPSVDDDGLAVIIEKFLLPMVGKTSSK